MADDQPRKPIKVGVRAGGGSPPGYKWKVDVLDHAYREAMAIMDEEQYSHIARQFRELASEDEPTTSQTIDIRSIEDFFELRDKGGVLKKLNIRVFFCICREKRTLAVLGTMNKKNDGKTPDHVRILMRYRMRKYLKEYC